MRTRARTARRTVAALVAAIALAAAPLARADDATASAPSASTTRPAYIVGVAAVFAVTLAVLFFAFRAPAVDSSRLRAATDALDRAVARGRGGDAPGAAVHDNRSDVATHRPRAAPTRSRPPAWLRLAAAGARALAPAN